MLTVDRPVTQMLEVDTKRASRKPMDWPGLALIGSIRSSAPNSAPMRKPSMMIPVVVVFRFFISFPNAEAFSSLFPHYSREQ